MKILEQQDISKWSHVCSCNNCDSKLEVEASDLNYTYYEGDHREPSCESFSVACGVCKAAISIPNNSVPKLIKVELKRKHNSVRNSYYDR